MSKTFLVKNLVLTLFISLLTITSFAQNMQAYSANQLMERVNSNSDTLYVVNFWATWCGPCVKELPEFNKLEKRYEGKPVKILLVSLDFKESYPKKIEKFLHKKKMTEEVVWFNETNANDFIPKIESSWQGSIPATLILFSKTHYRNFFEGTITAEQLVLLIDKQLAYQ